MRTICWLLLLTAMALLLHESPSQGQPRAPSGRDGKEDTTVSGRDGKTIVKRKRTRRYRLVGFLAPGAYGLGPFDRLVGPPPGRVRIQPFSPASGLPQVIVVRAPAYMPLPAEMVIGEDVPPVPEEEVPRSPVPPGREMPREKEPPVLPPPPPVDEPKPPRKPPKKDAPKPPKAREPELPRPPAPADDPSDEARHWMDRGRESFKDLEYGRAAQRFRQAMRLSRRDALPRFLLAQALMAQGKYHEAYDALVEGLRLRPDWPTSGFRPLELYGDALAEYPDHLSALEDTLRRHPDDPVLLFLSAYQLWFDGRKEEARPLLRRALVKAENRGVVELFLRALPAEDL